MDDLEIEVRENKGIYYKACYPVLVVYLGSAKCYIITSVEAVWK